MRLSTSFSNESSLASETILWLQRQFFGFRDNSLASETINNVITWMVLTLYDESVCLPRTEADWANECKGFIENYELPCVGAWDESHVHVACRLKT